MLKNLFYSILSWTSRIPTSEYEKLTFYASPSDETIKQVIERLHVSLSVAQNLIDDYEGKGKAPRKTYIEYEYEKALLMRRCIRKHLKEANDLYYWLNGKSLK